MYSICNSSYLLFGYRWLAREARTQTRYCDGVTGVIQARMTTMASPASWHSSSNYYDGDTGVIWACRLQYSTPALTSDFSVWRQQCLSSDHLPSRRTTNNANWLNTKCRPTKGLNSTFGHTAVTWPHRVGSCWPQTYAHVWYGRKVLTQTFTTSCSVSCVHPARTFTTRFWFSQKDTYRKCRYYRPTRLPLKFSQWILFIFSTRHDSSFAVRQRKRWTLINIHRHRPRI